MRNEENICQYCTRQCAITTLSLNACLNKLYQEWSYLLIASGLLNIISCYIGTNKQKKTASANFTWLCFVFPNSFVFSYFNSNISSSVHLLGIWWFFALDLFSNVLFQTFDSFWYVSIKLSVSLCWHILHQF